MKRIIVGFTLIAASFTPLTAQASPFAFQQSVDYPSYLWFVLDKMEFEAAKAEAEAEQDGE